MTRGHKLGAALYFFILIVIFLGSLFFFEFHQSLTLLFSLFNIWLLLYFLFRGRHVDFFEPIVLFTLANLRFLSRPIQWALTNNYDVWGWFLSEKESWYYTYIVLSMHLGAIICYIIGYNNRLLSFYIKRGLPKFPLSWSKKRLFQVISIFFILGLFSFYLIISKSGGLTYILSNLWKRREIFEGKFYFFWGSLLLAIGFLLYSGFSLKKGNLSRVLTFSLIPISMIYFLYGGRGTVFSIIIMYLIIYHYSFRRLNFRTLIIVFFIFVSLGVYFLELRVRTAGYTIMEDEGKASVFASVQKATERIIYFDSCILCVKGVHEGLIPLQYGKTYLPLLVSPIPRVLWSKKPALSEDKLVWDAFIKTKERWGIPFGFLGITFVNFHILGIIVGFFLLGVFHKGLYEFLKSNIDNPSSIIIYGISIWWFHNGFSNGGIMHWLLYFIPCILALKFVTGKGKAYQKRKGEEEMDQEMKFFPHTRDKVKEKVLVTGGAGFLGSNLVKRLLQDYKFKVTVLDNFSSGRREFLEDIIKEIEVIEEDITNPTLIKKIIADKDIVFHLAAKNIIISMQNPQEDMKVNIEGTFNVLKACLGTKVKRFVYASTSSIYGNPKYLPINEDDSPRLLNFYSVSKYAGENYTKVFYEMYNLPTTIVRYSNVYGYNQSPRNPYCGVVGKFIKCALLNQPLQIHGDGEQTRDYTFVEDAIEATILVATNPIAIGREYNVGTGREISVNQLAQLIIRLTKSESELVYVDTRDIDNIRRRVLNIERIRHDLKFYPKYTLEKGVEKTIEWIKRHELK